MWYVVCEDRNEATPFKHLNRDQFVMALIPSFSVSVWERDFKRLHGMGTSSVGG